MEVLRQTDYAQCQNGNVIMFYVCVYAQMQSD